MLWDKNAELWLQYISLKYIQLDKPILTRSAQILITDL